MLKSQTQALNSGPGVLIPSLCTSFLLPSPTGGEGALLTLQQWLYPNASPTCLQCSATVDNIYTRGLYFCRWDCAEGDSWVQGCLHSFPPTLVNVAAHQLCSVRRAPLFQNVPQTTGCRVPCHLYSAFPWLQWSWTSFQAFILVNCLSLILGLYIFPTSVQHLIVNYKALWVSQMWVLSSVLYMGSIFFLIY